MPPPWDIYVDERKVPGDSAIGFLVVPNTSSFSHKLFRCRHRKADEAGRTIESREVHWSDLHRGVLQVAENWIGMLFQHRSSQFFVYDWPRSQTKEQVILHFLARFCEVKRLVPPHDIVVILDHDSSHAKARIQDNIRNSARIARCYHFDGAKNDCLQCCDLLLGAVVTMSQHPDIREQYTELHHRMLNGDKLKNSEVKRYLSGYLAKKIDKNSQTVYDCRRMD